MTLPSLSYIVRHYMYGSDSLPNNFVNPNLIRPESAEIPIPGVSSQEFMAGPGRFALASSFEAVAQFFDDVNGYDVTQLFVGQTGNEVRLTKSEWAQGVLGLSNLTLAIDHKDFDDGQDSFSERVFLWGNTSFQLSDDTEFVVTRTMNGDGTYSYVKKIDNLAVMPRLDTGENFDFVSIDGTTTQTQGVSQHAIDPSGIGRKVNMSFVDDVPRGTLTEDGYWDDVAQFGDLGYSKFELNLPRQSQLQSGTQQIFDSLFSSGITSTVVAEKLVVYGTTEGDTFSAWTTPAGHDLFQQYESVGPYSFLMPQFQLAPNGLIYVAGAGDDTITGTSSADVIFGGDGTDALFGGGGDDFIFFDAADGSNVNGGAGRDMGFAVGNDGVTLDMADAAMEILVGGTGADTFIMRGDEDLMAAGGGGSDDIIADFGDGQGLRTVWGGVGADTFFISGLTAASTGIVVATVAGLAAENFHLFDKSMLNLGSGFDWSQIHLLILNPDSSDRIAYGEPGDSEKLAVRMGSVEITASVPGAEGQYEEVWLTDRWFMTDAPADFQPSDNFHQVGSYKQTFLGGYSGRAFTSAEVVKETLMVIEYMDPWDSFVMAGDYGEVVDGEWQAYGEIGPELGLFGNGWNGEYDTDYDLSGALGVSDWVESSEGYSARAHYFEAERPSSIPTLEPGGWFFVGGGLSGSQITGVGSIQADMTGITDSNVADWLLVA